MSVLTQERGDQPPVADGQSVRAMFARRVGPVEDLTADADTVARICHAMAERFRRGGQLIVFGNGAAATDAQHIAVEFVHPVIVGRPALPAVSLTTDAATLTGVANRDGFAEVFSHQLQQLAAPDDIALGVSADGDCENVLRALLAGRGLGLLTVAMVGGAGGAIAVNPALDHVLLARSSDPRVVKEVQVTTYHLLWELTQMFLERSGAGAEVADGHVG